MSRVVVNEIQAKVGNDISFNDAAKIDTLKGKTTAGSIAVQGEGAATTNMQQGLIKMWGQFDQRGDILGANTEGDTFNITSQTDVSTSHIDVTIDNNMNNSTYSLTCSATYSGTEANDLYSRFCGGAMLATTGFRLVAQYSNGSVTDSFFHGHNVSGDLA